ncbi:toxin RelE [Clostridia bacterium]|nr:toxin RelE [Clostridia bacterium]
MERYEVVVTPSADTDIDGIFAYISKKLKGPDVAIGLIERIYKSLKTLEILPKRHALSRDKFLANQGFRSIKTGNYLAFYVVDDDAHTVVIHRVLHGRRNYAALFGASEIT